MTREHEPVRVLVVDDNARNRALLAAMVESEQYQVVLADGGKEGLDVLRREPVDLVLLDVMMPGTNGIEVTRIIKSTPELCDIPIIVITAADDDGTRLAALEAGAEEFLPRPIRRIELTKRVRNLVRLKRLNDAVQRQAGELQELVELRTREVLVAGEKLESVLNALPILVFTAELTSEGLLAIDWVGETAEAVTGLSANVWTSGRWVDFVGDELRLRADFERLASAGRLDTKLTIERSGIQTNTFLLRANVTEDGRVFAVALDISEHEQLEKTLHQTRRLEALGEVAGGVAHDFNNLLMIITSFTSFASRSLGDDHPVQSELAEVLEASDKAAALTRQLLIFAHQQPTAKRPVDLGRSVESIVKLLRRTLGENIELDTFVTESAATVFAEQTQVDQILMNLAVNARDAMPHGGKLAIAVESVDLQRHSQLAPGPYVRLTVSDTGLGMPTDVAERVFEPFFTTKGAAGTGLGLATTYGIVQTFDGAIELSSREGVGTTFVVLLPKINAAMTSQTQERPIRLRGDECILVVEDQAPLLQIARRSLTEWGYEVLLASDPHEAKHLFTQHRDRIDLVLTDIILPNGNGEEFAEWVEAQGTDTKVLLTSGYLGRRADERDLRFPILWKPYTPLHLLRRLRLLLDGEDNH